MERELNRKLIRETILELRDKYLLEEMDENSTYFNINNGNCEEFAFYVLKELTNNKETDDLYCLCNDNFKKDDCFDGELLEKYWEKVKPPEGLTFKDLDEIDFGYHIWLYDGTYHYDAECPEGVENFFELPIFSRMFKEIIENKDIDLEL